MTIKQAIEEFKFIKARYDRLQSAAASLPGPIMYLQKILWAIFNCQTDKIERTTYWRGLKILLIFFHAQ